MLALIINNSKNSFFLLVVESKPKSPSTPESLQQMSPDVDLLANSAASPSNDEEVDICMISDPISDEAEQKINE